MVTMGLLSNPTLLSALLWLAGNSLLSLACYSSLDSFSPLILLY
jgi:hypothetical protein